MTIKILNIQSSASMDWSLTRKLSTTFIESLSTTMPKLEVDNLDLVFSPPPFVTPEWISGAFSKTDLSEKERLALVKSDKYIEQVEKADLILIGAPMYNYGMPASLKAWFDQIARINKTFSFDLTRGDFPIDPILYGKILVLMTSSGEFGFEKGSVRESVGHLVPHIKSCAHYIGVDSKNDFYHIGVEYQEFKDLRHEQSKRNAFDSAKLLANSIREKYFLRSHANRNNLDNL